jgi:citrate synthase
MAIREKHLKKVFKLDEPKFKTSITKIEPNKITTRGYPQEELIDKISYAEMVYLLLKGKMPSEKIAKIFNHVLVSFCDHGVTPPSTQTGRLVASSGSPLNVSLSGGLLSFGKNHAGAIEKAMELFQKLINESEIFNTKTMKDSEIFKEDRDFNIENNFENQIFDEIAKNLVETYLKTNKKVPGFGHRYHDTDPRALKLIEILNKENYMGIHVKLALAIEKSLFKHKKLRINIDGMNAAILSDMGFSPENGTGLFIIGRLPGLIAHINEEVNEEAEFRKLYDLEDILYLGKENKHLSE